MILVLINMMDLIVFPFLATTSIFFFIISYLLQPSLLSYQNFFVPPYFAFAIIVFLLKNVGNILSSNKKTYYEYISVKDKVQES